MAAEVLVGDLLAQVCGFRWFSVLSLFLLLLVTWRGVYVV